MTGFSDAELERYARHIVLREIGGGGQNALRAARVTVIGAGGIGCPAIQYLAAAGIGRIAVVDDDRVALSNLQRQVLFGDADIGRLKVEAVRDVVARLNPHVEVDAITARVTPETVTALIARSDVVLDGCDNFATRLAVSDACTSARIPLVSAALGQFQGQIATFRGWEASSPCYRCFVGDAFDADDCDTCAELGVLGAMAGMIGSWAAMETIRVIAPFGPEPVGRVHIFDGVMPTMRSIKIAKDPTCRGCGNAI